MKRGGLLLCCGLAAALGTACGGGAPPAPVPARQFEDPGFVAAGGYELRYGAVQASGLAAEVAADYGIERRDDRLVVNLSVLQRRTGSLPVPVEAQVAGTWRNLIGEAQALEFRRVTAGTGVSYVAEAPLRDRESIVLELQAQPAGSSTLIEARLTRQFDLN